MVSRVYEITYYFGPCSEVCQVRLGCSKVNICDFLTRLIISLVTLIAAHENTACWYTDQSWCKALTLTWLVRFAQCTYKLVLLTQLLPCQLQLPAVLTNNIKQWIYHRLSE